MFSVSDLRGEKLVLDIKLQEFKDPFFQITTAILILTVSEPSRGLDQRVSISKGTNPSPSPFLSVLSYA
jgi:hypothetical protein